MALAATVQLTITALNAVHVKLRGSQRTNALPTSLTLGMAIEVLRKLKIGLAGTLLRCSPPLLREILKQRECARRDKFQGQ